MICLRLINLKPSELLLTADELAWLGELSVKPLVSVQQLSQAQTNQVFLITAQNNQQFIFKRLNINARNRYHRKQELAVHKMASDCNLSPKVLGDCSQYRLQAYIKGKTLNNSVTTPHILKQVAAQLRMIHQLPAKYAPLQSLTDELLILNKKSSGGIISDEFQHFLQLATQLDKSSSQDILCHGDLSFNNLVQTENRQMKILDWEYAVLACPAYDLASCCCINDFNIEEQELLIRYYYLSNKAHISQSLDQLYKESALYHSVFTYLNKLWGLVFIPQELKT